MTENRGPGISDPPAESSSDTAALVRRNIGISKRRSSPRFFICDSSMRVLFADVGLEYIVASKGGLGFLKPYCRESALTRTTVFHALESETVLRIVPLSDQLFGCFAIFVDAFGRRGSVLEASKTFGLTKRESEVLQLLVTGKSNSDIAAALCVAEGTVGDHVKSIMRKAGTNKRVELIGKIFNLEQDIAV